MTPLAERALPPAGQTGHSRHRAGMIWAVIVALVGLVLVTLVLVQLARPVPAPKLRLVTSSSRTLPGHLSLPWPRAGQAVVEVDGLGRMGDSGTERPAPTASVAKVMTAYVFLSDHPLSGAQEGPTYRVSAAEAARLPWRKARGETHVDVVAGQPFTEQEALEALLIVSANNIAHELARWDVGGDAAFAAKMNATARRLGMTGTRYTDPSGFDATTVSTASDQVRLFGAAMRLPAFAQIVGRSSFTPRTGGRARSGGNTLLGTHGVLGGKTGFTSRAGANYVFAARARGRLIVGAVMSQPGATSPVPAVQAAEPLIVAAERALTRMTLAPSGARLAEADYGLGNRVGLVTAAPVQTLGWPGLTVHLTITGLGPGGRLPARPPYGSVVATATVGGESSPLRLDGGLSHPSVLARLTRLG